MEDTEQRTEDQELDEEGEEPGEEAAAPAAAGGDGGDESIQEILVKQEAKAEEEEEEDDSVLSLTREDRLEPLAVKVVPAQPTEFTCSNCFLLKHRSQLKDKAKMLCRDCA